MDRKVGIGVLVVCSLAVATKFWLPDLSLANFSSVLKLQRAPAKTGPFDFYKLSIQWPKSFCNTGRVTCEGSMKTYFTIHGLWPNYSPDAPVKPYSKDNSCTTEQPTPPESIVLNLFNVSFRSAMETYWPNLLNYASSKRNLDFWRYEWAQHGMCSAYPTDPLKYFDVSVFFINYHDLLQTLSNANITPGNDVYNASAIADVIGSGLGAIPNIHCNEDSDNRTQLHEIRICWDKENNIKDCPRGFTGKCKSEDMIRFPAAN